MGSLKGGSTGLAGFKLKCSLSDFNEAVSLKQYITHCGKPLRNRETVTCPFHQCPFKSNIFSGFTSHECCCHPHSTLKTLRQSLFYKKVKLRTWLNGKKLLKCNQTSQTVIFVPLQDHFDNETKHHDTTEKWKDFHLYFCESKQSYIFSKLATQEIVSGFYEIWIYEQDQCIYLALYIDVFEVCNPLGTSRNI